MGIFDSAGKLLKPLKPVYAPFEFVGKKVAVAVNYILLSVVYFTAFAATAIVAKAAGKHFLELKVEKERKSYWIEQKKEDYTKKETYRGF